MSAEDLRSLPQLIGSVADDVSTLFRKEVELAKAEVGEKVSATMGGIATLAIGGVLAIGALGVLLAAAVSFIAGLFIRGGMDAPNAHALSGVIVGVIVAVAALVAINRGRAALAASNFKLERTAHSLERDAAAVKERI